MAVSDVTVSNASKVGQVGRMDRQDKKVGQVGMYVGKQSSGIDTQDGKVGQKDRIFRYDKMEVISKQH